MIKHFKVVAIKEGVIIESKELMKQTGAKVIAKQFAQKYMHDNDVDVFIETTAFRDYGYLGMDGPSNKPSKWI